MTCTGRGLQSRNELVPQFYKNLYAEPVPTPYACQFVRNSKPPQVEDSPIPEDKLFAAVKSSRLRWSGCKFYAKFWQVLEKSFTALANRLLGEGSLSEAQRKGLIALLSGSRSTDLRAWRPITLLNCDYKLSKCLSVRRTSALSAVLHPYQACCVHGRSTTFHGFAIRDLIE